MLDILETESPNPNTTNIDELSIEEILKKINEEDKKIPLAVEKAIPKIAKVVEKTVKAIENGGRVIYMGAGTSGRIAFVDAVETVPTFSVPEGLFFPLIAGGKEALSKSLENVEDMEEEGARDLEEIANVSKKDVVIGITASGRTPYVKGGLIKAKEVGATVVLITNVSKPLLEKFADITIKIITGPEVITGSTRMKAGTSQKMVLNMISTATMIKIGKVYKNYMVDLKVLNSKLKKRAVRIISEVTGISRREAEKYIEEADLRPKLAILMILSGKNKKECEETLKKTEKIHEALKLLQSEGDNK
ncbi:MAG: N-acetylmuramic acid 6-phosphate etherase [Thermotogaceae bacterium]|nr:N-acetylmuramic acid 6-phosphate etherase [Thermotogaceae bacterium]